jgi:hypothetical protein
MGGLVLLAVTADGIIRRECLQEVGVEFFSCSGDQPTGARQAISFLMDQAVIPPTVVRLEDLMEMIGHRFVVEFREATGARGGGHVSTFRSISSRQVKGFAISFRGSEQVAGTGGGTSAMP